MTQAGSTAAEQPDAETEAPASPAGGAAPPHRGPVAGLRTGLVIAAVFVLGLTLGAMVVGLLSDAATLPTADQAAADLQDGNLVGSDLDPGAGPFEVNGACLGAVNAAQDAYATMDELGQAAAGLDAAQLDEVVRRLQPLQQQLEEDVAACRVTEVDNPSSGDPGPGPSTAPRPGTGAPSPSPGD
jgi:hypothetical protein